MRAYTPVDGGFRSPNSTCIFLPPLVSTSSVHAGAASPKPAGKNEDCLAAANAWVKEHPGFELVLGLIEDEGRGWPHAWVRNLQTQEELDPSRPEAAARYLALPKKEAPRAYLDLLGKRRTLTRVAGP